MTHLAIAALLLTVFNSISPAQTVRTVQLRTLCLDYANDIQSVVIPGGGPKEVLKIQLYTEVSPVLVGSFTGNEAAFFIEKPPGPDGKPVRELVGKTSIGKSEHQLFVFQPGDGAAGSLPYLVRSFDDDTGTFAMGSVRAINLAPVPIRFLLSGQLTPQIPPTKYAQFPHSKKVNEYNMYPVVVEFLSGNGQWISGQSVSWKSTDRRRDIVITSVDPRFKQPVVKMFADFPPWMEPAATAAQP